MKDKKKSPLVNEKFIKERYSGGNPLTSNEIQNMFKDAFLHIFENCFQSEIEDKLEALKIMQVNLNHYHSKNRFWQINKKCLRYFKILTEKQNPCSLAPDKNKISLKYFFCI